MIPLHAVRELVERHEGSRVQLLRNVACGTSVRLIKMLLESGEARKTVEAMDVSAFLRLLSAVIEKSIARRPRKRLKDVSSVEKAASLLGTSKNVLILTGAGISTSCGIPDFRSASGVYSMLGEYALKDPQDLFAISYFRQNIKPFYHFARKLWPGTHKPAITHEFIKFVGSSGRLLRNYTQNIDTLEHVAGIENIVQCHGSFATATCTRCKYKCAGEAIKADVMAGKPPMCPECAVSPRPSLNQPNPDMFLGFNDFGAGNSSAAKVDPVFDRGCMKPDIVFFGEKLPTHFFDTIEQDVKHCDLVVVMGTSLKVAPVSRIVEMVDESVPQILINREVVGQPHEFDVELLGDCDVVALALAKQLGCNLSDDSSVDITYRTSEKEDKTHRYLFRGGVDTDSDCDDSDSDDDSDDDSKDNSTSPDCEPDSSSESKVSTDGEEKSGCHLKRPLSDDGEDSQNAATDASSAESRLSSPWHNNRSKKIRLDEKNSD